MSNHVHLGMGLVLQVGNASDMPAVPHNFPRCGNYVFQPEAPVDPGHSGSNSSRAGPAWAAALLLVMMVTFLE